MPRLTNKLNKLLFPECLAPTLLVCPSVGNRRGGGRGSAVTYRLVGGGRCGQLRGLPSSYWVGEVVVGSDLSIKLVLGKNVLMQLFTVIIEIVKYLKRISTPHPEKTYFREVLTWSGIEWMPYSSIRRRIVEGCWHGHVHRHGHRHGHCRRRSSETSTTTTPSTFFVVVYINQVCLHSMTHLRLTKEWIPSEVNKHNAHPSLTVSLFFFNAYMDHCFWFIWNVVVFGDFYQVMLHQNLGRGLHT